MDQLKGSGLDFIKIGTAPIIVEEREAEKWLIMTLSVQ